MSAYRLQEVVVRPDGWRVLIVADDARRAARLSTGVANALGIETHPDVVVRSSVDSALAAAALGVDLCLFDLSTDGGLDVEACLTIVRSRRARRVLVIGAEEMTPLASEAVLGGASGFQMFDDGGGDAELERAVREALVGGMSTSEIAHQLNNVFGGMLGLISLLGRNAKLDAEQRNRLHDLRREAERGVRLATGLAGTTPRAAEGGPGSGTSFEILLQRANETPGPGSTPGPRSATILVVEDDDALRSSCVELLQTEGYNVLSSGDGFSALLMAGAHRGRIHLVVSDVIMQQMSGIELWRKLSRSRPEATVLFVTGDIRQAQKLFDRNAGAPPTLAKPFAPQAFLGTVRSMLATHPFLREESPDPA